MHKESISLLLLSDTHLGFDLPNSKRKSSVNKRGQDFISNFDFIIDKAIDLSVNYVVHCGDVFETQNVPPFLVDHAYQQFLRLANADIDVMIVPGNHERSVLPPSLFLNHPRVHVFDRSKTFSFPGISFSGFPYFKGNIRGEFNKIRLNLESNLNKSDFNILCVHHAIDGVKAGFQFFEFRNRPDTINIDHLPGDFDLILSGHIHKHQEMELKSKEGQSTKIIYSGSTEKTMLDEIDEIKGYHIFKISNTQYSHQFHPLNSRSMHVVDLRNTTLTTAELKRMLMNKIESIEHDSILFIKASQRETLYELSRLKTQRFFPSEMIINISGFSKLQT